MRVTPGSRGAEVVGEQVGLATGCRLGLPDGFDEGAPVGCEVGEYTGMPVGCMIGSEVIIGGTVEGRNVEFGDGRYRGLSYAPSPNVGMLEGMGEEWRKGSFVDVGTAEAHVWKGEGRVDGSAVGIAVKLMNGMAVGDPCITVGIRVGLSKGSGADAGIFVGFTNGGVVRSALGTAVGTALGTNNTDGEGSLLLGLSVGDKIKLEVRLQVGAAVGFEL